MNEHSLTPCPPLTFPAWYVDGFAKGDIKLAGLRLVVTAAEVEQIMERVSIITAEGETEYDAQHTAMLELRIKRIKGQGAKGQVPSV